MADGLWQMARAFQKSVSFELYAIRHLLSALQHGQRPLERQQLSLHGQAAGKTAQRRILCDNAMAGDDDRQRIRADRIADSPGIAPSTDTRRNPLVRTEFAKGNPLQRPPYSPLECGPPREIERDVEPIPFPRKIVEQLASRGFQSRRLSRLKRPACHHTKAELDGLF